jgi:polar amino acid transport system substrate-binding protein
VFNIDFGCLIYRTAHSLPVRIESAESFDDLGDLVFIGQQGEEWERDNIPASLETVKVGHLDTMMHLLVRRRSGDFLVMPTKQPVDIARRLGYDGQITYHPVEFIPNARTPFHVGLPQSRPASAQLIETIDDILDSSGYQQAVERILADYR